MTVTTKILALFGVGARTGAATAAQQRVMLYGTVRAELAGSVAPLPSARVFFDTASASLGPLLTDDHGHFVFYDTNRRSYKLRVFLEGGPEPVLTQIVTVPERSTALAVGG